MILQTLKYIGAAGTIITGLVSVFWPTKVLGFTGLDVAGGRGITEIRTILGAVFIGIGVAVLYFNQKETYQVLGITYLVMGAVRVISMITDKSVEPSNIISAVFELGFGVIFML